ncbi:MAG: hypothetical protein KC431_04960 [Myxococcales bacterium]|nr:hypothetical protein [Myxococcales bacterium]MCA9696856.1 hypothetical protein [Myxococcales bacterium]
MLVTLTSTLVLAICAAQLSGCDGVETEPESLDLDDPPDGVRHAVVDGVESWELEGVAAHEWYRQYLAAQAQAESDSKRAALTWEKVELIDGSLEDMEDIEGGAEDFRAKSAYGSLTPISSSGKIGWSASATATKTGLPASLEVQTKVQIGSVIVQDNKSKWGTGTISGSASNMAASPSFCYARYYAHAGGTSAVYDTYACQ